MTTQTVKRAVERREQQAVAPSTPTKLIELYSSSFAAVLPEHIKPETWMRLAQGALKRGKKVDGERTELEVAAQTSPHTFLASLLDAARLGLAPGTEEYWLTPRTVKGKLEILGIVGYQGHIELMYRAGAVESVVAEVVYPGEVFTFNLGVDLIPQHQVDWAERGAGDAEPKIVYAYARLAGGGVSKVVVLNRHDIARTRKTSAGSSNPSSPWQQHITAMWLKTAVRQLQKWVPTSAEYIRERIRAARDVAAEPNAGPGLTLPAPGTGSDLGDIIDGEIERPAPDDPIDTAATGELGDPPSEAQTKKLFAVLRDLDISDDSDRLDLCSTLVGRRVLTSKELSGSEVSRLIDQLDGAARSEDSDRAIADLIATAPAIPE